MKRILVGVRNGKAAINWPGVLAVGLLVGIVCGAGSAVTWYLLTQEFNVPAFIFPVPLAIGYFTGEAWRIRTSTPLDELHRLD